MSDDNSSLLFSRLRKFVSIIDELRDLGLQSYISLPRIAVLGVQSAGKSSLLESIVGYDFQPRGEGLCTRRPLELRLVHNLDSNSEPYGVFDGKKDEKIKSFPAITKRIEDQTEQVAGSKKGIVDDPIRLTITSHSCPDLTLIDLPGITKVPLRGSDQKENIEKVTTDMCLKYCKDPRTIILIVIQANQDIATSDAQKIAMQLDREGERSFAVVTKVDLMDSGTDAYKILNNDEIPQRYGYVGVKGRSQADIVSGVSIKKGLQNEEVWFDTHEPYSNMPNKHKILGTHAQTNKLTFILNKNIKQNLPKILEEIKQKRWDCEESLKKIGEPLPRNAHERIQLVTNLFNRFIDSYKNTIKGKFNKLNRDGETIGSQMRTSFIKIFEAHNDKKTLTEYCDDKTIERAFINFDGDAFPGSPSYDGFLSLLHPFIDRLYEPAYDLIEESYNNLENTSKQMIADVFLRFPALEEQVGGLSSGILMKGRDMTRKLVKCLQDSERNYIFTSDENYSMQYGENLPPPPHMTADKDKKTHFIKQVRNRLDAYLRLVQKNLKDSIPKIIGQILLEKTTQMLHSEIYTGISNNKEILECLNEPEHLKIERDTIEKARDVLEKALKKLSKPGLLGGDDMNDGDDDDYY